MTLAIQRGVFSATQCIGGKTMAGLFHFPVGDTGIFKGRFPDPAPNVAGVDSVSGLRTEKILAIKLIANFNLFNQGLQHAFGQFDNPFAQVHEITVYLAVDLSDRAFPVFIEPGLAGRCIAGFVLWKYDNFIV
jgi:hypothetical protein